MAMDYEAFKAKRMAELAENPESKPDLTPTFSSGGALNKDVHHASGPARAVSPTPARFDPSTGKHVVNIDRAADVEDRVNASKKSAKGGIKALDPEAIKAADKEISADYGKKGPGMHEAEAKYIGMAQEGLKEARSTPDVESIATRQPKAPEAPKRTRAVPPAAPAADVPVTRTKREKKEKTEAPAPERSVPEQAAAVAATGRFQEPSGATPEAPAKLTRLGSPFAPRSKPDESGPGWHQSNEQGRYPKAKSAPAPSPEPAAKATPAPETPAAPKGQTTVRGDMTRTVPAPKPPPAPVAAASPQASKPAPVAAASAPKAPGKGPMVNGMQTYTDVPDSSMSGSKPEYGKIKGGHVVKTEDLRNTVVPGVAKGMGTAVKTLGESTNPTSAPKTAPKAPSKSAPKGNTATTQPQPTLPMESVQDTPPVSAPKRTARTPSMPTRVPRGPSGPDHMGGQFGDIRQTGPGNNNVGGYQNVGSGTQNITHNHYYGSSSGGRGYGSGGSGGTGGSGSGASPVRPTAPRGNGGVVGTLAYAALNTEVNGRSANDAIHETTGRHVEVYDKHGARLGDDRTDTKKYGQALHQQGRHWAGQQFGQAVHTEGLGIRNPVNTNPSGAHGGLHTVAASPKRRNRASLH